MLREARDTMWNSPDSGVSNGRMRKAAFIHDSLENEEWIHVFGELDIATEPQFQESIRRVSPLHKPVVVDLTRCTYADSSAVHVLEQMSRALELRVIVAEHSAIQRVFEIVVAPQFLKVTYVPVRTTVSYR